MDIDREAYEAALEHEREGYAASGKTERVKAVDAELKRGKSRRPEKATRPKGETTDLEH